MLQSANTRDEHTQTGKGWKLVQEANAKSATAAGVKFNALKYPVISAQTAKDEQFPDSAVPNTTTVPQKVTDKPKSCQCTKANLETVPRAQHQKFPRIDGSVVDFQRKPELDDIDNVIQHNAQTDFLSASGGEQHSVN